MTVGELIDILSAHPREWRVIYVDDGCITADIHSVTVEDDDEYTIELPRQLVPNGKKRIAIE